MNSQDELNIILIDDDEAANYLNTLLIRKVAPALTVTSFTNARVALDYFADDNTSAHASRYLIFLDINMPVMDGFEFLDRLQTSTYSHVDITVIILSSSMNSSDKNKAESYVIYDYYSKPLQPVLLKYLFEKFAQTPSI